MSLIVLILFLAAGAAIGVLIAAASAMPIVDWIVIGAIVGFVVWVAHGRGFFDPLLQD